LAERVGFEPTDLSVNGFQDRRNRPLCHLSRAQRIVDRRHRARSPDPPYGPLDGVGFRSPFRSKIEALPDGTSITWILSVSFWMYWYWRIWSDSDAASALLAVAWPLARAIVAAACPSASLTFESA
jgi:hypothetical protein